MILYNLFPLLAGPFSKWSGHLTRAAGMGFEWVFVNPIQQLGASRSLYSIADYFSFNPALLDPASAAAPVEQVRQMTAQAHAAGLKVMIDLVINHSAIDAPLTREHPEWFVREKNGRIANASCQHEHKKVVWKDLAQFDHRHTRDAEGLYRHCLRIVEFLLSLGFDGFRCDAAYQLPKPFWQRLLREIKARHCYQGCADAQAHVHDHLHAVDMKKRQHRNENVLRLQWHAGFELRNIACAIAVC